MSLLNFNFVMIFIIHNMLLLLKNCPNYLKVSFFEYFYSEYNRLVLMLIFFSQHIMMARLSLEEEIIIKDIINFFRINYTEYESNGDKNKKLSVEEYLNEIRPHLKDIINDLKKSDTSKFPLITWIIYRLS